MSWKLAELRWRHDVGLQESGWERHNGKSLESLDSQAAEAISKRPERQRSHTTPWSQLGGEGLQKACDGQLSLSLSPEPTERVQSYPETLGLCRDPPVTSRTPLLTPPQLLLSTVVSAERMCDESCHPRSGSSPEAPRHSLCQTKIEEYPPQIDKFQGDSCPPRGPTAESRSTSGMGDGGGRTSSHSSDVYPETRAADHSLNSSHQRGSADTSSIIVNDHETLLPQVQNLESYIFDNHRLDISKISASRSFGLHLDISPSENEQGPTVTSSVDSSEYTSFPACFRRPSSESRHHSDSCLLEKYICEDSEISSSCHSQTMRTLYPDLRSAHAQIQGHRVASQSQTTSSALEPRFPFSRSNSSSDDDDDFTKVWPFPDANIPLRDLTCHRVKSALGVLHVGDQDHLESSAILETVADNTTRKLHGRLSYTVDDIISHYVDPATGFLKRCGSGTNEFYPTTLGLSRPAQAEQGNAKTVEITRTTMGELVDDPVSGPPDGENPGSVLNLSARLEAQEVDDYEWETLPESSRSGFLNPSGIRFRLAKKDTGDAARTSTISRKSPATPWDPLPNKHRQLRGHPGLNRKRLFRTDQSHIFSDQSGGANRGASAGHTGIRKVRRKSRPEPAESSMRRLQPLQVLNLAPTPNDSLASSQVTVQASSEDFTPLPSAPNFSPPRSALLYSKAIDRALPSSSLLPKHSKGHSWSTIPLSSGMNISTNGGPVPHGDRIVSDTISCTAGLNHRSTSRKSSRLIVSERDRPTISGLIDLIADAIDTNEASEGSGRPIGHVKIETLEQHVHSSFDGNAPPHDSFVRDIDCVNDVDASHFIRDSQRLRSSHFPKGNNANSGLKRPEIRKAGSSLADCSSGTLQPLHSDKRNCHAFLGSPPNAEDTLRSTNLSNATKNTYASSSLANYTFSSRFTDIIPSSSESSAELKAHGPFRDVLIDMEHCPTFPLTPAQLSITRLNGVNRIPFERIQLIERGVWLEKAWCFVHGRAEFSHTLAIKKMAPIVSLDAVEAQRDAGRFLLLTLVVTYMVGGFVLAHDMGKEGSLSSSTMAVLTGGVVSRIHSRDVRWAQAIEKAGLFVVFCVMVGCVGVLVWAFT
ncbi:hypothetical protein PV08_03227 [Exophiala spinifera]|uniref:Uncharacterized protein n=1 Tax=Exophiala spinifera TaxID=91928 RepID=A0A0D2BJ55_9EURO|nr:uncharacterized protein PV08_03227 [Exophiala spinifera]KIW18938.1 hypothetical protein PV08_03227 [Exophiala spinifera]